MQGGSVQGEVSVGEFVVFQSAQAQDFLSVEWLGATCYPVVHGLSDEARQRVKDSASADKQPRLHGIGIGADASEPAAHTFVDEKYAGPLFVERRVFCLEATSGDPAVKTLQYGQTVRLLNVFSNLYLSSVDTEGEGARVVLEHPRDVKDMVDDTGMRRDVWKLLPRHKVRDDGERIRRGEQLFLMNVACGFCLNPAPMKGPGVELWCGLNDETLLKRSVEPPARQACALGTDTRGAWAINLFEDQAPVDRHHRHHTPQKNAVRCLDMVVIFHKEMEGFLTAPAVGADADAVAGRDAALFLEPCAVDKSTYSVLELPYSTNALFEVSAEDPTAGGGVEYKKRRYRLRHVASQMYLTLNIVKGENMSKAAVTVTLTARGDDPNTVLVFQPLDSDNTEACICRNGFSRMQFAESGLYLHGCQQSEAERSAYTNTTETEKVGAAKDARPIDVTAVSKGYFEDVLAIRVVKPAARADLLSFISPSIVLSRFVWHWSTRRAVQQEQEDWRGRKKAVEVNATEVAHEKLLNSETAAYLHKLIRALSDVSSGLEINVFEDALPKPHYSTQRMLFEHGLDVLLFSALQAPLQLGGLSLDVIARQCDVLLEIYKVGFRLLEQMIRGAKDLAVRLATHIPFLETQLKHELNIASALMQIVANNREILESLNQRQLESFCFLVPQYGRNPTYLTLLAACCVCEDAAVPQNQNFIGQCLSGATTSTPDGGASTAVTIVDATLRPCTVNCLRVFYPIKVHHLDGLHIKPYSTFPPSTERKVQRFLLRYEADRRARNEGLLLQEDCDISSSESSLSSDSEEDMPMGVLEDEDVSDEEEEVAVDHGMGDQETFTSPSHLSIKSFLYKGKKSQASHSWRSYVARTTTSSVTAVNGCWVWRCEVPAVAPKWRRQWFTLHGGYASFRVAKGGAVLRSIPVVEFSLVYKQSVPEASPPSGVRNFGLVCEMTGTKSGQQPTRKLLICAECIGERNELLNSLRSEVRQAEAAIEGTMALSGDPFFAAKNAGAHNKKTASLQSHMKSLLRKHRAYNSTEDAAMGERVTRVTSGTRFDTQWQSLSNFIKHRSPQAIQYLEAQLLLFSRLCAGNNEFTLTWVQSQMTREVIREGLLLPLDHSLAPAIKAAFADLAVTLYLLPAEDSEEAQSQRHLTFIDQMKTVVDDHLRRIPKHRSVAKQDHAINEHRFTAAVLRLCDQLIASRGYTNAELTLLLPPLLKVISRHPPAPLAATVDAERHTLGIFNATADTHAAVVYRRDRNEPVTELMMNIMITKREAGNVLMRLFRDQKTYRLMSTVFPPPAKDVPDLLTTGLLSAILHIGNDQLFLTCVKLLFRNLSNLVDDGCEEDPAAHNRLAVILQSRMEERKPDVILALFKLLDGGLGGRAPRETTLAVMKSLTCMIYQNRDKPVKMAEVQTGLDRLGLSPLVVALIESKDDRTVFRALDLMVAIMDGGNTVVQGSLSYYFLNSRHDEALFVTLRNRIASAMYQIKDEGGDSRLDGATRLRGLRENNLHHIRETLRVMQLFAEGHNIEMQNYLREQTDNVVSYNLVKESFSFLCAAITMEAHDGFTQRIVVQAFNSLTEFCQGPCKGNQIQLIKGNITSQVTGALSRSFDGLTKEQINEIRTAALLCLHSVLEGVTHCDPLAEAVQHTADPVVLRKVLEETWDDRKSESSLEVAFNIFILLKMLRMAHQLSDAKGFQFLDAMTGGIEICRDGRLEHVYFRIPSISANLSDETKDELLRQVDRSTPTARISDFYYRAEGLIFEIEYYQKMFHEHRDTQVGEVARMAQLLLHNGSSLWQHIMIGAAFFANIMLLVFANVRNDPGAAATDEDSLGSGVAAALLCASVVQLMVTACLVIDFLVSKAPLITFKRNKQERLEVAAKANQRLSNRQMMAWWHSAAADEPDAVPPTNQQDKQKPAPALPPTEGDGLAGPVGSSEPQEVLAGLRVTDEGFSLTQMLWLFKGDTTFLFYALCFVCALLSITWSPFFLSIHLLAVSGRSPVLMNVITAVTRHSRALILTALLGSVVVYLFTIMAFTLFRTQFEEDQDGSKVCDTLSGCFKYLLVNAVRAGGGVGDLIQDHSWYDRPYMLFGLLSDFLFFVIIIVILLNIISGVIIDTFARLREERQVMEDDIRSRCFICGIESTQFDRQGDGFEAHTKQDHNLWFYVYFIHHLFKKDVAELTGQESYVHRLLLKQDLGFFPLNKAIVLEGKREEEDRLLYIAREDKVVRDRLADIELRVSEVCFAFVGMHTPLPSSLSGAPCLAQGTPGAQAAGDVAVRLCCEDSGGRAQGILVLRMHFILCRNKHNHTDNRRRTRVRTREPSLY